MLFDKLCPVLTKEGIFCDVIWVDISRHENDVIQCDIVDLLNFFLGEKSRIKIVKSHLLLIQCYYRRKPKLN